MENLINDEGVSMINGAFVIVIGLIALLAIIIAPIIGSNIDELIMFGATPDWDDDYNCGIDPSHREDLEIWALADWNANYNPYFTPGVFRCQQNAAILSIVIIASIILFLCCIYMSSPDTEYE